MTSDEPPLETSDHMTRNDDATADVPPPPNPLVWMAERNCLAGELVTSAGVESFVELIDGHAAIVLAARG